MVCVKDTATAPSDMLVSRLPSVCTQASGRMFLTCGEARQPSGDQEAWVAGHAGRSGKR